MKTVLFLCLAITLTFLETVSASAADPPLTSKERLDILDDLDTAEAAIKKYGEEIRRLRTEELKVDKEIKDLELELDKESKNIDVKKLRRI